GIPDRELFTDLEKVKIGDQFVLTVLDEKLAYEVDKIIVVKPEETDSLQIEPGRDIVTLITCTPYMEELYEKHSIGSISIPSIKVNIPLFDTTTAELLQIGATVVPGTSYPTGGEGTHSMIAAHSGIP
ncbi:sortase, partial [Escherichia coli]